MKMKYLVIGAVSAMSFAAAVQASVGYGITGSVNGVDLIRFDTANPAGAVTVGSLSNIPAGHAVRAIDFRSADGKLYALSVLPSGLAYTLHTVDLTTAALTPVGTGLAAAAFPGRVSMDIGAVSDVIRIVTGNNDHFTLDPDDASLLFTGSPFAYAPSDPLVGTTPFIADIASVPVTAGPFTLEPVFAWDFNEDVLAEVPAPSMGQMYTVGGPPVFITNNGGIGMDFSPHDQKMYMSYPDITLGEVLATVDLSSGGVSVIDNFPVDMLDIAINPAVIPEPATLSLLAAGLALAARRSRR
jgi:hypothetical protein